MQFVYLLFNLDFRNLRDCEGSEIKLPHRLERTLQQPEQKQTHPLFLTSDKGQNIQQNGYKQRTGKYWP